MGAVYKREMRNYFTSPIAYIVLVIYALMAGLAFIEMFGYGVSEISYIFSSLYMVTMLLAAILTMRLFSEERRQKTDQVWLTAPVKLFSVVMGKFLAALSVFALATVIVFVFQLILSSYVAADWAAYFSSLLGTLLLVSALIAIGIFISSLTESQVMAAICTVGVSVFLMMTDYIASVVNITAVSVAAEWISFSGRFTSFLQGVINYADIAFFVSVAAIFLFLTGRTLESRRWA